MDLSQFIEDARAGKLAEPAGRTKVRKERVDRYKDYYYRTGQTHKDQERQREYQRESYQTAHRHGDRWESNDLEMALRLQQPIMVSAEDAQRTYAAIRQGRYRFLRRHGLRNDLLKEEQEEYDRIIRHESFRVEDLIEHDKKWSAAFGATSTVGGKPARGSAPWGEWEMEMLKDPTSSSGSLAKKLGRSVDAVTKKRQRMRLGW